MAANPYERIADLTVIHRVGLSRYSSAVVRKVLALLKRMDAQLIARLSAGDLTATGQTRLEQLIDGLLRIQSDGWNVLRAQVTAEMVDLAAQEADFALRLVALAADAARSNAFTAAPAPSQVVAAVIARPFQGRFLRDWMTDAEAGAKARVRNAVRQGFIEGQTIPQLVKAIRGTRAMGYRDGVLEISRRGAEAMVRTAVTHTASVAHEEVYKVNGDVITGVIWTSTLDSRTTKVCMARSEKVYPIDKGPRPPAHVGCRSTTRPQVRPIPGVAPYKAESYSEWLNRQPVEVQNDILGPKRAALYRDGGLELDRFVDRTGREYTLAELRQRDAAAFARASL
jgi:SPP1 gp7 family putative phage head morphogenesis protein